VALAGYVADTWNFAREASRRKCGCGNGKSGRPQNAGIGTVGEDSVKVKSL
jgi:hypothetical protein